MEDESTATATEAARQPILIVGAGPTGLVLALWLQKFGVPFRIVDAAAASGTSSRAVIVHARTIELYRQLGLDDRLIATGTRVARFAIHHNNSLRAVLPLHDSGRGLSKYPFILSSTQDDHEALLEHTLVERGGQVERGIKVVEVKEIVTEDGVLVTLSSDGKEETVRASYVIGCDGAHSAVRRSLGIAMEGSTYDRSFFVADVIAKGTLSSPEQVNLCLSDEDLIVVIPLPHDKGRARLVGFVPQSLERTNPDSVTFTDIKPAIHRNASHLEVEELNWFSRYKCHHRTAARFQHNNRVFLCGDAAHIHSPVGGQGMNTGIGDASNLGWKLAAVYRGTAPPGLLDTYAAERVPFAKQLVATTDRAFTQLTAGSVWGRFIRNIVFPYVLALIIRFFPVGRFMFRRISQIGIAYPSSPVSTHLLDNGGKKSTSTAQAGDRLPWIEDAHLQSRQQQEQEQNQAQARGDNHGVLFSADWQLHIYTEASPDEGRSLTTMATARWVEQFFAVRSVTTHRFLISKAAATEKGLRHDAAYLVRPDGHIGLVLDSEVGQADGEHELVAYCERWGVGRRSVL